MCFFHKCAPQGDIIKKNRSPQTLSLVYLRHLSFLLSACFVSFIVLYLTWLDGSPKDIVFKAIIVRPLTRVGGVGLMIAKKIFGNWWGI